MGCISIKNDGSLSLWLAVRRRGRLPRGRSAWREKDTPEGWNVYALVLPKNDKWNAGLCVQKASQGPLYKVEKLMGRAAD